MRPTRRRFSPTEVRFFHGFHSRIRSTRCPRGFHQIRGESFHHPFPKYPRNHPGRQFFHGISRFGGDSAAHLACRGDSATSLFKETPSPHRRVDSRGTRPDEFAVARDLCLECVPAERVHVGIREEGGEEFRGASRAGSGAAIRREGGGLGGRRDVFDGVAVDAEAFPSAARADRGEQGGPRVRVDGRGAGGEDSGETAGEADDCGDAAEEYARRTHGGGGAEARGGAGDAGEVRGAAADAAGRVWKSGDGDEWRKGGGEFLDDVMRMVECVYVCLNQ